MGLKHNGENCAIKNQTDPTLHVKVFGQLCRESMTIIERKLVNLDLVESSKLTVVHWVSRNRR